MILDKNPNQEIEFNNITSNQPAELQLPNSITDILSQPNNISPPVTPKQNESKTSLPFKLYTPRGNEKTLNQIEIIDSQNINEIDDNQTNDNSLPSTDQNVNLKHRRNHSTGKSVDLESLNNPDHLTQPFEPDYSPIQRQRSFSLKPGSVEHKINDDDEEEETTCFKICEFICCFPVISPHSTFRTCWDLFVLVLIIYLGVSVPLQTAFDLSSPLGIHIIDGIVDFFFIADLILNFNTGLDQHTGIIHYNRLKIAKNYCMGWFWIDLVSSVPFEPIYFITGGEVGNEFKFIKVVRFLRFFRLMKLFRLVRIVRLVNRIEMSLSIRHSSSQLIRFFLATFIIAHWSACIFSGIAFLNYDSGDTWIHYNGLADKTLNEQYIAALHWAVMTMTTIGYGDIQTISSDERIFAIFAMIIGACVFGYGLTNIVQAVADIDSKHRNFRQKLDQLNEYMNYRRLPQNLRRLIRDYFYFIESMNALANEEQIITSLSPGIQKKIARCINTSHLVQAFRLEKVPNSAGFCMELSLSLERTFYPPLEEIVHEGDYGEYMFVIMNGSVDVVKGDKIKDTLKAGNYFGELAVLGLSNFRTATILSREWSECMVINREDINHILPKYPEVKKVFEDLAKKKLQNFGEDAKNLLFHGYDLTGTASSSRNSRRRSSQFFSSIEQSPTNVWNDSSPTNKKSVQSPQ